MRHGNFEVWIASGGNRFSEYCTLNPEPRQPGPHVVKTYIESQRGQAFGVNWRVDASQDSLLCITTRMDGVLVDQHASPAGMVGQLQGIPCGPRSIRLFQFSSSFDLQSNHSVDLINSRLNEGFGSIEVTIAPIRALKSSKGQISGPLSVDGLPIFGQATHCIAVGEERIFVNDGLQVHPPVIPLMPALDVELKVKDSVTFLFRYRSRVQLKTLGIQVSSRTETAHHRRPEDSAQGSAGPSALRALDLGGNKGVLSVSTLGKRPRDPTNDSDTARRPQEGDQRDPQYRLEALHRTLSGVSRQKDSVVSTDPVKQEPDKLV